MAQHRKPIHLQLNEGDPRRIGARKLRDLASKEPRPTCGLPPPPPRLTALAKECWEFLAEELEDMQLDKRPDALTLEGACALYSTAVEAQSLIDRDGPVIEEAVFNRRGEQISTKLKPHPATHIAAAAWRGFRAFAGEFGLTPAARTRLAIEGNGMMSHEQAQAELAAILAQPRPPRELNELMKGEPCRPMYSTDRGPS